jgi:hypothetical protein
MIEDGVLFAARHKGEASQIGEGGSSAILPIEPEQRICRWELVRGEIATNGPEALTQFHAARDRCHDCQTYQASGNCEPD